MRYDQGGESVSSAIPAVILFSHMFIIIIYRLLHYVKDPVGRENGLGQNSGLFYDSSFSGGPLCFKL